MAQASYAGVWHTDFGVMELEIKGTRVTGTYGPNAGRLEGALNGKVMIGTWRQSAPGSGGATWGTFELTFSADGQTFTCRWHYQDTLAPGWGHWYGRREQFSARQGAKPVPADTARRTTAARQTTPPAKGPTAAAVDACRD